jgi:hypothetical protein
MTKEQWSRISTQRGIISKIFKYLEFKGILYAVPLSETLESWDAWGKKVKKEHPIQYFIRENIEDIEDDITRSYSRIRYYLRTLLFPEHKRIRDSIPVRGCDVASIIENMNFAAILQFKEEADKSQVDWAANENHKEFKDWLDRAVVWINEGKANLEKELDRSYPTVSLMNTGETTLEEYNDMYKDVHRLEDLIKQTDENILVQMMKYREYFWT